MAGPASRAGRAIGASGAPTIVIVACMLLAPRRSPARWERRVGEGEEEAADFLDLDFGGGDGVLRLELQALDLRLPSRREEVLDSLAALPEDPDGGRWPSAVRAARGAFAIRAAHRIVKGLLPWWSADVLVEGTAVSSAEQVVET